MERRVYCSNENSEVTRFQDNTKWQYYRNCENVSFEQMDYKIYPRVVEVIETENDKVTNCLAALLYSKTSLIRIGCELYPMRDRKAETVTKLLVEVFSKLGLTQFCIHPRTIFESSLLKETCKFLELKKSHTKTYPKIRSYC